MRADDGEFHGFHTILDVQGRGWGKRGGGEIGLAGVEQALVGPGGRDQRDPETGSIVAPAGGERERRHVEQVDEIGVEPEVAVQRDRCRADLGDPVDRRRGRQREQVDLLPHRVRDPLQLGEPILTFEHVYAADGTPRVHDGADSRVDRLGVRIEQRQGCGGAFRYPGAAVEQHRRLAERRHVHLDQFGALFGQRRERLLVQAGGGGVAEEDTLVRRGYADPARGDGAVLERARIGVGAVEAGDHCIDCARIGDGVRQHGDAIERAARGHQPAGAPAAFGGFHADQAVERGGDATRPGGVGAERERHQSGGDRDCRTGARSAADIGTVEHACGCAVGAARAVETGGELVEVGLAHRDRACRYEAFDHARRDGRRVGEVGARGGGRYVREVDIVLDRERHSGERQHLARGDPRIDAARVRQDIGVGDTRDPHRGLDHSIGLDTRERGLGDADRVRAPGCDGGGDWTDFERLVHHATSTASIAPPGASGCRSWT